MRNHPPRGVKVKSSLATLSSTGILFIEWVLEVSAFVLLPLVLYIITFASLGRPISEALESPEVMLIAIILYGEILRKLVLFYTRYKGFKEKFVRVLSLGVLGITVSSVLLCFSLAAEIKKDLSMSGFYYFIEGVVFCFALALSAFVKIWPGMLTGETELYTGLSEKSVGAGEGSKASGR
jgi:hypothetical protein